MTRERTFTKSLRTIIVQRRAASGERETHLFVCKDARQARRILDLLPGEGRIDHVRYGTTSSVRWDAEGRSMTPTLLAEQAEVAALVARWNGEGVTGTDFFAAPSLDGLAVEGLDTGSYIVRVGYLYGGGLITGQHADELLAARGVSPYFTRPAPEGAAAPHPPSATREEGGAR